MKKRMKRIAACLMAAAMTASLAACGGGGSSSGSGSDSGDGSSEPITLNFSFDQGVGEATQQIVDAFNESQDKIQVETVLLPQDTNQVHDDFVNKLASGDTSVDIMGLDVVYVAEFASAGWLYDLTDQIDTSTMLEGPVEGATYDGKLVAAPWFTNSSVLFYRTDVLEELNAEVPTTWEGWMELADQAVGINGVEYGADFQASQSEAMVTNWCEYVWGNGGDILDENGNPVVNSENNIEATNIMKKLVDDYAPEGVTTYAETESEQVFKEGKCLFIRDWSGFWSSGQDEGSKVTGKIAATKLPVGPSGTESHTCLGGLDLVVNNAISDEKKEAAVEFINYMTSFDTQKEMTIISSQPPVVKEVYTDDEILEEIPFYADFYDIIMTGKSRPSSPQYSQISDAIQRNIHQALTGEVEVEAALDTLQGEIEEFNSEE
ncbi:MAG TPA: ABC transporter substrate-binding protein [Candidatus Mediterraneibacter surreyensis]|nr:ABC transporter substrate-binding protein [Candidatus Mediterraneibacter surreyensis]